MQRRSLERAAVFAAIVSVSAGLAAAPGYWSSTGPYGGVVYGLESEPGDANRMYATSNAGLYRSGDAGATWARATNGLGDGRVHAVAPMVDAERPQDVYALDAFGRLHRSTDRADNWVATGYQTPVDMLALELVDVPGSSGQLLMLASDYSTAGGQVAVLRSTDNGATFSALAGGLPAGGSVLAYAFDPADATDQLLVHAAREEGTASPVPFPATIYRSVDGGASWSAVHAPSGTTTYIPYVTNGAISFGAGDRVYALSNETIVRSDDRGATWTETGTYATDLVAHPSTAGTVFYADRFTVLQSTDGGATGSAWAAGLSPNSSYTSSLAPGEFVGIEVTQLHADPGFPATGTHLWASSRGSGLFRRQLTDLAWGDANDGLAAVNIRAVAVHPNPASVHASGTRMLFGGFGDSFISSPALYRSNPALFGLWDPQNSGLRAAQVRAITVDPTTARSGATVTSAHVYAVGGPSLVSGFRNGGLYKSTNNGNTWTSIDAGLPTRTTGGETAVQLGTVRSIVLDPRSCPAAPVHPQPVCAELPPPGGGAAISPLQRVYVAATGFPLAVGSDLELTHRLLRSNDGGSSWTRLDDAPGFPASRRTQVTSGTDTLQVATQVTPIGIAIDPTNSSRLFVSTFAQLFCSNQTAGTECTPAQLLAHADVPSGVFRSTDGGANWTAVNGGLPRVAGGFTNTVQEALSMVMHPTDPNTLWVSMTELARAPADRDAPIWKTTDGGTSWSPASTGIPQGTDVRALTVDAGDGNRLYAAGAGTAADPGAVYRSDDGGATWMSISIGLPADSATALAVDPHNASVLHAGTNSGVWSIEQLPDADGDGIPDATENFAPNGGDGNGDGDGDATQGGVGSTIVILGPAAAAAKGASTGFLTTEIVSGTGTCAQAVDVQNKLASRYGRDYLPGRFDYYTYPRDVVQFEIMDCASAVVDVIFHNADFRAGYGWSMRFHGPSTPGDGSTIGWHDISDRATQVGPNRWRLSLEANAFGSYRPVDDRILFVGGPACYDDRVFVNDFEAVPRAKPGCN